ncbi:MAG TPA: alpha/beta hydrolase [Nocardioidaceae bacterium]|nr:alpha/beta hydrolase [Nocardioidaceae bacterium]
MHPFRRGRAASVLAALSGLLLLASGCTSGGTPQARPTGSLSASPLPKTSAAPSASPVDLRRFYTQKVSWHDCRGHDRCMTMTVPLDYAHPDGKTISLAVLKVPAADPDQKVGALVVNPGGPGGSGIDYAASTSSYFGAPLHEHFDIVGFDPRGVGESTPIHCESTAQLDRFVAADPDPDTKSEIKHSDHLLHQLGEGCVEHSGSLTAHISTREVAKDMDILRAVLGDAKLTYFGASYGTLLGATYAGLFPHRVGRMVLDGALNPDLSSLKMDLIQAHGFEVALRSYAKHCVDAGGCFLGDSVDAATERIRQFLADVEQHPLPGSGGRKLKVGNAVLGIWAPLYAKSYWPLLDNALKAAFNGQGAALLALSDAYTSRGPNGYTDNSLEALYAVNCLDRDDSIPSLQVPKYIPRFEKASPTFGAIFAFGLSSCSTWPVHTHRGPHAIHAPGAPPILVIGTTRDPATPLAWARALANQLDSGILIKRDGDGHTGYHHGNACVDNTVEAYLVSGKVPSHHEVDC